MKRILNLSTGGCKALSQLPIAERYEKEGKTFDLICGKSQGAINALMIATLGASESIAFWQRVADNEIKLNETNSWLSVLFKWKNGRYNWDKLREILYKELAGKIATCEVWITVLNELNGHEDFYVISPGSKVTHANIDIAIASASPMGLTSSKIIFSDPGFSSMLFTTPILELDLNEFEIVLINAHSSKIKPITRKEWEKMGALDRGLRGLEILSMQPHLKDMGFFIAEARDKGNKNPIDLYIVEDDISVYEYTPEEIWKAINAGKNCPMISV